MLVVEICDWGWRWRVGAGLCGGDYVTIEGDFYLLMKEGLEKAFYDYLKLPPITTSGAARPKDCTRWSP